jgi:hypothetical protein
MSAEAVYFFTRDVISLQESIVSQRGRGLLDRLEESRGGQQRQKPRPAMRKKTEKKKDVEREKEKEEGRSGSPDLSDGTASNCRWAMQTA